MSDAGKGMTQSQNDQQSLRHLNDSIAFRTFPNVCAINLGSDTFPFPFVSVDSFTK